MSRADLIIGDVRDCLAAMPDGSVDLVLTSPPFLALRSYLPADHPNKHLEIGSEPTPAEFLTTLLGLTAEFRRVLAPHGSICVELGDTYAGSGGAGGDYYSGGQRDGEQPFAGSAKSARVHPDCPPDRDPATWRPIRGFPDGRQGGGSGWPEAKSLCGIPHLYHLSLAYGRNLLTGEPCEPWRIRNVIAWCRPNPPVGALGDKFRPATSYMTVATVARDRYFDLDAVRTPSDYERKPAARATVPGQKPKGCLDIVNPAGAPPLDWWEIPTQHYHGSHYAVWPPALLDRPIKAMCPRKVCTVCGEPSRRIVGEPTYVGTDTGLPITPTGWPSQIGVAGAHTSKNDGVRETATRTTETIGWTDCGCDGGDQRWRNGIVLDPFAGSGTTLMVATGHGRDAIGFDLDERNADLARERIGMFLTEWTLDTWKAQAA